MKLELTFESERVAPGEEIRGQVTVLEGGPSQSLALTIGFHERSPAYGARPFLDSVVVREGALAAGDVVDFRYPLPAAALPSAKGKHGELYWELEVASDDPGLDTRVSRRIEVVRGEHQY